MRNWLTVAEGAECSGVSRDTIYTTCDRGELQHDETIGVALFSLTRLRRPRIPLFVLQRPTCRRG